MNEYIKKEDAAERVALELMYEASIAMNLSYKELVELEASKQERIKMHVQKWLEQVPSADVVEVVRCKDCKKYMTIHCTCDGCCISDEWYCADGERKDGESDE